MKTILQSLEDSGINTTDLVLVGTMELVPAGSREHWTTEKMVDVFKPAVTKMHIEQGSTGTVLMSFVCDGEDLSEDDAFWSRMQAPAGVDRSDAANLAKNLVEFHRDLTGEIRRTYEVIESDPAEIARIKIHREELKIGLKHLTSFVEKDNALFDLMFSAVMEEGSPEGRAKSKSTLRYERDCLLATFIRKPCDQDLYDGLRTEYGAGAYVGGLRFEDYYNWFRKSEAKFSSDQGIAPETRDVMKQALTAWCSVGEEPNDEWLEGKQKLFNRNFEVHPRHQDQVKAFLLECVSELQDLSGNKVSQGAKP